MIRAVILCFLLIGPVLGSDNRCYGMTIKDSLDWLATRQKPDGSWQFDDPGIADPGTNPSKVRATATTLLAFLGAGQTHLEGKYQTKVKRGLGFLLRQMKTSFEGGDLRGVRQNMVTHAIATLALCETYSMTADRRLRAPAQQALDFIVASQDPKTGGWAAKAGQSPSTTVLVWQVLSLKSGFVAKLDIPPVAARRASGFLDRVQVASGTCYGETSSRDMTSASTAAGLIARMHLGWDKENSNLVQGLKQFAREDPPENDLRSAFFGLLLMRQAADFFDDGWKKWNATIRDDLVALQWTDGKNARSWYFPKEVAAASGGRLYHTAMSTMLLEIYYRHMPIYRRVALAESLPVVKIRKVQPENGHDGCNTKPVDSVPDATGDDPFGGGTVSGNDDPFGGAGDSEDADPFR
jgi:hypothetical protein